MSGDFLKPHERSILMSKIGSRNTKPEKVLRSLLHREGYRFRLNVKDIPGRPDIVLPKFKTVILVHGCFWHGHNCHKGTTLPRTNADFWRNKINRNKERDHEIKSKLASLGWKVITVWECELKDRDAMINRLKGDISND